MISLIEKNVLYEIVGSNIQRYRLKKGVSVSELASALGVSYDTASAWERGRRMPRAGAVEKLAKYFDVMKSDIISDSSEHHRAREVGAYEIIDLETLLNSKTRLVHSGRVLSKQECELIRNMANDIVNPENGRGGALIRWKESYKRKE